MERKRADGHTISTDPTRIDRQVVRIMLGTRDAHGLYARFGFVGVDAARLMERGRQSA